VDSTIGTDVHPIATNRRGAAVERRPPLAFAGSGVERAEPLSGRRQDSPVDDCYLGLTMGDLGPDAPATRDR
jgi:hypothetical protein